MSSEASANIDPATNYNTLRAIEPPLRPGVHAPEQRGYPQLRVLSQRISDKVPWISAKPPWISAKPPWISAKPPWISAKPPWISAKHAGYPQGTQDIRKGHVDIRKSHVDVRKAVWMSTTPPQQIEDIRCMVADIRYIRCLLWISTVNGGHPQITTCD
ncbi:hypothetical protein M422DRAFT_257521 [Sphaerobolus stellatus SS14]|uniref:Uncharacterized protein n=1 Tax=Sphaerobolus stellatus (strain SS14) TaxID=990650 RepID=A0A0C9VE64_SPHS4|nr:hypothetical protein M422DRAFT_257521 [Sphaerobolus stellatus SS14]